MGSEWERLLGRTEELRAQLVRSGDRNGRTKGSSKAQSKLVEAQAKVVRDLEVFAERLKATYGKRRLIRLKLATVRSVQMAWDQQRRAQVRL